MAGSVEVSYIDQHHRVVSSASVEETDHAPYQSNSSKRRKLLPKADAEENSDFLDGSSTIVADRFSSDTSYQNTLTKFPEFAGYPFQVMNLAMRIPRSQEAQQKETTHTRALIQAMGYLEYDPSSASPSYTNEESALILHLKEDLSLSWNDIWSYFPHRTTAETLRSRYSKKLQHTSNKNRSSVSLSQWSTSESSTAQPSMDFLESIRIAFQNEPRRSERIQARGDQPGSLALSNWFAQVNVQATPVDARYVASESNKSTPILANHSQTKPGARPALDLSSSMSKIVVPSGTSHPVSCEISRLVEQRDIYSVAAGATRVTWRDSSGDTRSKIIHKPYLSAPERNVLTSQDAESLYDARLPATLHVAFTPVEIERVEDALLEYFQISSHDIDRTGILKEMVHYLQEGQINKAAKYVISSTRFMGRTEDSVAAFLSDIKNGTEAGSSAVYHLRTYVEEDVTQPQSLLGRSLRHREMGVSGTRLRSSLLTLRDQYLHTYSAVKSFSEMSGDVNTIAWSPTGCQFAVGAAALTDVDNMQYNNANNLLYGNIESNQLFELPQHAISRQAASGLDASDPMLTTQDPLLYTTISAIAFSEDGRQMFTGGRDRCVRVWDLGSARPSVNWRVPHAGFVDLISATSDIFAAGSQAKKWPIKIYRSIDPDAVGSDFNPNCLKIAKCAPSRKHISQDTQLAPTALQFNPHDGVKGRHLLAGFAAANRSRGSGELCVWDLEGNYKRPVKSIPTKSIFDAKWHMSYIGRIVAGCAAGSNVNRGIKSVVRIYDCNTYSERPPPLLELECPASDMNDVELTSLDANLVSAGCTDGKTYVWDLRKPSQILHVFTHGPPISPLPNDIPIEEADTGIRFLSWGPGRKLYTGSSDGVVASWNPYRAPQDAFCSVVTQLDSGVISGCFSPDFRHLIVGEERGAFHLLQAGAELQDAGRRMGTGSFEFVGDEPLKQKLRLAMTSTIAI